MWCPGDRLLQRFPLSHAFQYPTSCVDPSHTDVYCGHVTCSDMGHGATGYKQKIKKCLTTGLALLLPLRVPCKEARASLLEEKQQRREPQLSLLDQSVLSQSTN